MKSIDHDGYKELQVTFKEFINLLRPDNKSELKKYFYQTNGNFIFRGQSSSKYDLTPSAFREDITYSFMAKNYRGFCLRQYLFLESFVRACDLSATPIPNDSYDFREWAFGDSADCSNERVWPDKRLYELIGLAQHYGYPTEFLDWSYNPLVACYFAASGVIKNTKRIKSKDLMSVWVFDVEKIHSLDSYYANVELINIPRALNANISAQEGCFILVRPNLIKADLTYKDKKIQEIPNLSDVMHKTDQLSLLKISIKQSDAVKILDYCHDYRINAATLFRGYEGAARYAVDNVNRQRFLSNVGASGYRI